MTLVAIVLLRYSTILFQQMYPKLCNRSIGSYKEDRVVSNNKTLGGTEAKTSYSTIQFNTIQYTVVILSKFLNHQIYEN